MATETYELRVSGTTGLEYNECVMHFQSDNVTANDTFNNGMSLIDSWETNIKAPWLDCLDEEYFLMRLAARRAFPKPSVVCHKQYDPLAETGTFSTGHQSDNLCPSVFLLPPMGVKSGGKVFMPTCPIDAVVDNAFQALYQTRINSLFNTMISNFGTSGVHWQMAIYSRKLAQAHLVQGFQLTPRLGFQGKRRKPL